LIETSSSLECSKAGRSIITGDSYIKAEIDHWPVVSDATGLRSHHKYP